VGSTCIPATSSITSEIQDATSKLQDATSQIEDAVWSIASIPQHSEDVASAIANMIWTVLDAVRAVANIRQLIQGAVCEIQGPTFQVQGAICQRICLPASKTEPEENLMARIRLNLRNLTISEKIAKGRQVVTALTNNASFPTPTPPLSDVTAGLDDLDKASTQVRSAKAEVSSKVGVQDNAEMRVDQLLTQLAGYIESVAGRDDTLIASAGLETKTSRSAPTIPTEPQALSASPGTHEGELLLSWKPVPNAKSYMIESSTDPSNTTGWAHLGIATSATKAINNLKSGTRYWFRVAAIGSGGESGWSEPATKVAP
jgi:fibronectin type III domain protein